MPTEHTLFCGLLHRPISRSSSVSPRCQELNGKQAGDDIMLPREAVFEGIRSRTVRDKAINTGFKSK